MMLPATARSPLAAREFTLDMLDEWRLPKIYEVVLIVNELVTNAVVHATGESVMVSLDLRDDAVRVVVGDNSAALPRRRRHDPAAEDGRGLALVAALSTDWGVHERDPGKAVWADVSIARPHIEFPS